DRQSQVALYNYALGGVEGSIGDVIVMHEAGPGGQGDCDCATSAVVTRDAAAKKTYYEIKLPAKALGLTPPLTTGTKFGLGMAINDGDSGPGQNGQKGWGGLGAHAIVFGKTPQQTAGVTLGTTVSGGDLLFLSAINPGLGTFTFRASDKGASVVDPSKTTLTLNGNPAPLTSSRSGDAVDFTHKASIALALGVSHSYTITARDTLGNTVTDQGTFRINPIRVGLNFGSELPSDIGGSALPAEEVAGAPAVAQAGWRNLREAANAQDENGDPIPVVASTETGLTTSMSVVWNSVNTWASTGLGEENNGFTGNDGTLMAGYLDTDATSTTTVKITGVPDALTAGGYDVYVYALGGVSGRGGGYRVVGTGGAVLKNYVRARSPALPSVHKEVPQNGPAGSWGEGTFIVFENLKATEFTIQATGGAPNGTGLPPRAPINALQLVPTRVPPAPAIELQAAAALA
ncbi:MAG: hypothetical protein ACKOET_09545, partial [Verrucomicrobiota bacterium]